jgi:DNA-binding SARP family transcriptional activator/ABC-type branched-subunit amino acid transport system substrate-binding protein/streptogramin lyase
MEFRILGPLDVRAAGVSVPLGGPKQRAVLALLLLSANRVVSRDRLIDELWPDQAADSADHALRLQISRLRKALSAASDGKARLSTHPPGYLLRVEPDELDLHRFERLVAEGRDALERDNAELAAARLREAEGLWRGRPLADLEFEPFVRVDVERLEELRLAALEDRIEADLARGRHVHLAGELDALVAQHPLRERLRAQLMRALYSSGRQAEALQAYSDARRHLVDELGIEPGPALRQLERAVLEHDPRLGAPDGLPSPRPARPPARAAAPASRARSRRRPVALIGAGAFLLSATAILTLLLTAGSSSRSPGLGAVASNSLAAIDPHEDRIVAAVPLGGTPTSVAVGAGAVWALNADDQTIARIDPDTNRVRRLGIAATPTDLAAGRDVLWVGSAVPVFGANRVLRVGADDLAVQTEARLPPARHQGGPGEPGAMAVGPHAVWAINGGEDLARIDPRTGLVTATVRGLRARAIAVDRDSVWVLAAGDRTLVRVDAGTATIRGRPITIPAARIDAIAAGAGAVWAVDSYDGLLWRIDPGRSPIMRTIPVGVGADGVAVGAGAVWVINSLGGTLVRVDPLRNRAVRTVAVGHTPRDVAVGGGRVWVTLAGGAGSLPAAAARGADVPRALPASACGRVFSAGGRAPDYLIASDVPLKAGPDFGLLPVARAVAFVLRQHRFQAGRYRLGYQSCDASTALAGQSDPKKCAANAKAYAVDPAVLGIVGVYNSDCAQVEIPILNGAKGGPVAMVSPSNSAVGLTQRDPLAPRGALARMYPAGLRNYARVYPAFDAEAAADAILARQLGLRRVYVLGDGGVVRDLALYFRRSARAIGLGVAGSRRWDPAGRGFRALADRVRRARADGVFLAGISGLSGGPLVSALRARLGARTPLIAANPFGPVDFIFDNSHGAAKGLYISSPGLPGDRLGSRGRRFLREFAATQPGIPIRSEAVYAAAATEVLLDAIARSDGTRPSVSRQLIATRLKGTVIGPVRFDANGDLVSPPVTIMRVVRRDGVSDVPTYEGAAINRIITPPPRTIG